MLVHLDAGLAHLEGKLVELRLWHRLVGDDDGIMEVTSADQILVEKELEFVQKDESPAGGNLAGIIIEVAHPGILLSKHSAVEMDHGDDFEPVIRKCGNFSAGFFVKIDYRLGNFKVFPFLFLFFNPCLLQGSYKGDCAAVHNRHLRAVNSDEYIVNTKP